MSEPEGSPQPSESPKPESLSTLERAERARRAQPIAVATLIASTALCMYSGRLLWLVIALISAGVYLWLGRCPRCRAFREAPGALRCTHCGVRLR